MRLVRLFFVLALTGAALVGCGKETSVKKTTTVTTPEGKTTETTETTVDMHGKNPPPAP
ncbi:MAG TPA: hypothetical protein VHD36_24425 [Pirellulales bacterium]|nr:hypothetical protein [Pirellulales bacterium]